MVESVYGQRPWWKHYDASVPTSFPIPSCSLYELLEQGLHAAPTRTALFFEGTAWRFADIERRGDAISAFLQHLGLVPGDTVGLKLANCPEYVCAVLGILKAGCVASGIGVSEPPLRIAQRFRELSLRILVTDDAIYAEQLAENPPDSLRAILLTGSMPQEGRCPVYSFDALPDIPSHPSVPRLPDDLCFIQYTGGTTGIPKGARITNRSMTAAVLANQAWYHESVGRPGQVYSSVMPYTHMGGLGFLVNHLAQGSTQILQRDPKNVEEYCENLRLYSPSILINVPNIYMRLCNAPSFRALDFSGLRYCSSGAAPMDPTLFRRLEDIVGRRKVVEGMGMTETGSRYCTNPLNGEKRIGSVGLPLPNVDIRIADPDTGALTNPGEIGELLVCAPQIIPGYLGYPIPTRELEGLRWMRTGDLARMDSDGYIFIVGRLKHVIMAGGFKVFPRVVEATISQLPDVACCVVFGVSNPARPGSELVLATVQPCTLLSPVQKISLRDTILAHCRARLSAYEIPCAIIFTDALPLTSAGKPDISALKQAAQTKLVT